MACFHDPSVHTSQAFWPDIFSLLDILASKALPCCARILRHNAWLLLWRPWLIIQSLFGLGCQTTIWRHQQMLEAKRTAASDDIFLELEAYPALAASTSCILHKERTSVQKHHLQSLFSLLVRMDLLPFKVGLSLNPAPAGPCAMDTSF